MKITNMESGSSAGPICQILESAENVGEESVPWPETGKSRAARHEEISLKALAKVLHSGFKGRECGFFFVPRRRAFQRMNELLSRYCANIAADLESQMRRGEGEDEDLDFEPSMNLEIIMSRIRASVARKLMRNLKGSVRVATLSGQVIHSFPITFGSFSRLIKSLEKPSAFEKKRQKEFHRLQVGRKKPKPPPIFFKMRARVPERPLEISNIPR